MHKYGLVAVLAFGLIALTSGIGSAGVATSGLSKSTVAPPASSIVEKAGWYGRCVKRCRWRGYNKYRCRRWCGRGAGWWQGRPWWW